jgi:hypothetical protein
LNFFNLLVQLSNTQNQFVRFAPQPFRPTLPYVCTEEGPIPVFPEVDFIEEVVKCSS